MPTKIRLQRHGKKGRPFYHIVIADGREPRDGRFIERLGTYNHVTIPAEITLDFDRTLYWLQVGAQPTNTVRSLLSYKGVLYKNHLLKGVKKGALTAEEAELKHKEWLEAKQQKFIDSLKDLQNKKRQETKKALEEETKVKEKRSEEIAKKRAEEIEKQVKAAQAKQQAEQEAADAEEKSNTEATESKE